MNAATEITSPLPLGQPAPIASGANLWPFDHKLAIEHLSKTDRRLARAKGNDYGHGGYVVAEARLRRAGHDPLKCERTTSALPASLRKIRSGRAGQAEERLASPGAGGALPASG